MLDRSPREIDACAAKPLTTPEAPFYEIWTASAIPTHHTKERRGTGDDTVNISASTAADTGVLERQGKMMGVHGGDDGHEGTIGQTALRHDVAEYGVMGGFGSVGGADVVGRTGDLVGVRVVQSGRGCGIVVVVGKRTGGLVGGGGAALQVFKVGPVGTLQMAGVECGGAVVRVICQVDATDRTLCLVGNPGCNTRVVKVVVTMELGC